MSLRLVSLVLLGSLLGCSNKVAGDSPPPNPLATSDGFCHAWAGEACNDNVVTACSGTATATDALRAACEDSQEQFCNNMIPASRYGVTHAQECLDAVGTAYADGKLTSDEALVVHELAAPCAQLIKGLSADGDACSATTDCDTISGSICILKGATGVCGVPQVVDNGTSCKAANASCHDGFYCDGSNCVQQKSTGDACATDNECSAGLACTNLACAAKTPASMCVKDSDCANMVCSIATGSATGSCIAQLILSPTAAACEDLK